MHLWPEKGGQGAKAVTKRLTEVTMKMVQLPAGPTQPQVRKRSEKLLLLINQVSCLPLLSSLLFVTFFQRVNRETSLLKYPYFEIFCGAWHRVHELGAYQKVGFHPVSCLYSVVLTDVLEAALQIEPGGQSEQPPPSGVLHLSLHDLQGYRFLTVSVAPRPVGLLSR